MALRSVAHACGRLVTLTDGVLYVFNPLAQSYSKDLRTRVAGGCWSAARTFGKPRSGPPARDKCPPELGTNAQASVEWGNQVIFMSGRGDEHLPCHVFSFQFLLPPTALGTCHLPIGHLCKTAHTTDPLWAYGEWTSLGMITPGWAKGRVGGTLSVVQDRLYVAGGVDERTSRFDGSVARWDGQLSDLSTGFCTDRCIELVRRAEEEEQDEELPLDATDELAQQIQNYLSVEGQPGVPRETRDCEQPWRPVAGLELPTAMHATGLAGLSSQMPMTYWRVPVKEKQGNTRKNNEK